MGYLQELGLRKIVNAAGKMTYLGGSTISEEVLAAMAEAGHSYIEMERLQEAASRVISDLTGAEAGMITSCAAAGIATAIAATLTGTDLAAVEGLPDTGGRPAEVIIQKGHTVNFGANITQIAGMTGARLKEIGSCNETKDYQLQGAINEGTAAILFVVSHHTVQAGMLPLEQVVAIAAARQVPVVVDAAAETDLRKYIAVGASLVIYSGQKAVGAPTSGFICGKKDLIAACLLQAKGMARAMKIGKEAMVGLLVALQQYAHKDSKAEQERQLALLEKIRAGLQGVNTRIAKDATRPIYRLELLLPVNDERNAAKELIKELETGPICIKTRNHQADVGIVAIDPRPLQPGDAEIIIKRINEILK